MRKAIIFAIAVVLITCLNINSQTKQDNPVMEKYLVPAKITQLEWILLRMKTRTLYENIEWDDFGVVIAVDPSVVNYMGNTYVGLVIIVDEEQYFRLENHVIEKLFLSVVQSASVLIKSRIPELEKRRDIHARFVTFRKSEDIAIYVDGKLKFIE